MSVVVVEGKSQSFIISVLPYHKTNLSLYARDFQTSTSKYDSELSCTFCVLIMKAGRVQIFVTSLILLNSDISLRRSIFMKAPRCMSDRFVLSHKLR